ncbi:MAG: RluA family pseudouridine synthase [Ruminococcaceae bacterium]|nr:RluA family pseudouridine synthase [Oscillospiraceae bacterium]
MEYRELGEAEYEEKISSFTVEIPDRADKAISLAQDISRSLAVKLIEGGAVLVNGKPCDKKDKLRAGDLVQINYPEPEPDKAEPEDIPLDIIYEDNDIIVINKPEGMIVHPATGIYTGTLVNALLYHCKDSLSGIGGVARPGIVHRIDKDTSGLLVVAKNDEAHISLSEQMKIHGVSRIYHALVVGNIKDDSGTINKPIGRHPVDRKKMAVILNSDMKSREAITHFTVKERYCIGGQRFTYVECVLETGRTHQIRVHMASTGHPLIGDEIYGGGNTKFEAQNRNLLNGQALHAKVLELTHPRTLERMRFECEMPTNMQSLIEKLRAQNND